MRVHTLTQIKTQANTKTQIAFSANKMSDHNNLYWLYFFYSKLNRMTYTSSTYWLFELQHINLLTQPTNHKSNAHFNKNVFVITCYWRKKSSRIIVSQRQSEGKNKDEEEQRRWKEERSTESSLLFLLVHAHLLSLHILFSPQRKTTYKHLFFPGNLHSGC